MEWRDDPDPDGDDAPGWTEVILMMLTFFLLFLVTHHE